MWKEDMIMRLIFRELFIFSPSEKKAKKVEFTDGINIITSSQEDGTDRGKSVIMRSLYHTMGAEGCFEKNWEGKDKVYVLKIDIDGIGYYIYRSAELFKFFSEDKEVLFTSVSSRELSEKLKSYTNFAVQLPNRSEKLEVTPPAYNYLPFYIDQDHYEGNNYAAFKNLGQYVGFRENVLFYHLGVYNEEYFELVHSRDEIKEKKAQSESQLEIFKAMIEGLDKKLAGVSVSSSYEALRKDVAIYQKEYAEVLDKLSKSKKKLIDLRNHLYETEQMLKEIEDVSKESEKKIKKLRKHICPECGTELADTIQLKSKNYNLIEDAILIKNDLQISLLEYQRQIEKEEKMYKELLEQMSAYEKKLKINNEKTDDVLRQKGLSELRDEVVSEQIDVIDAIEAAKAELKAVGTKINAYGTKKKRVEAQYYEHMMTARTQFGLNELSPDSFKKITSSVNASGSNKNIATIVWYITILELRKMFNKEAIEFPVVFDSPNNVETDNQKKYGLVQYITNKCDSGQLILSLLGFNEKDIEPDKQVHIITLTNDKYKLLDSESYELYKDLLDELCDAS